MAIHSNPAASAEARRALRIVFPSLLTFPNPAPGWSPSSGSWSALSTVGKRVLIADCVDTMTSERRTAIDAALTLRARIGGKSNLESYVASLLAGARKRGEV